MEDVNQNSIKSVSQKVKSHKAEDTDLKRKERKKEKKRIKPLEKFWKSRNVLTIKE